MPATNTPERFWLRVGKLGNDECWLWLGSFNHNGYGQFSYRGENWRAHRLAWVLSFGEIPETQIVRHKCDTRACCNPNHLELGSVADNAHDMMDRGRHVPMKGEAHGMSVLTAENIIEAKLRFSSGETYQSIANDFGVSRPTLSRACRGIHWKHL